jgi:hypothetical protein
MLKWFLLSFIFSQIWLNHGRSCIVNKWKHLTIHEKRFYTTCGILHVRWNICQVAQVHHIIVPCKATHHQACVPHHWAFSKPHLWKCWFVACWVPVEHWPFRKDKCYCGVNSPTLVSCPLYSIFDLTLIGSFGIRPIAQVVRTLGPEDIIQVAIVDSIYALNMIKYLSIPRF